MKAVTVIAIAMGAIAALETAAQDEQPVASVIAAVKEHFASECSLARGRMASSTQALDRELASVVVRMNCECLPAEIDRAGADLSAGNAQATTTQAAFLSRMKIVVNTCTARVFRADVLTRCEGEAVPGVADKKAYCGCLSARLDALDDNAIATAAATANRNFRESAQAKSKGLPAPAPNPTVLDGIEQECRRAAG
jgi:hypothetical protein